MAKTVTEAKLSTRTARLALVPQHKPYFRSIEDGAHIGYRRSTVRGHAGSWLGRRYLGRGNYETKNIGIADDVPEVPADGENVFTFDQAAAKARAWARGSASAERLAIATAASPSVADAVKAYVEFRCTRAAKAGRDAELRLTRHVLSAPVAIVKVVALTDADLAEWRKGITRAGRGARSAVPLTASTMARLFNDLRAALLKTPKLSADVVATIKRGLTAPSNPDRVRRKQVIAVTDVMRIVDAAVARDLDFGALVMALAATGARFDQIARVTVADLDIDNRRILVPVSAKGKGEKIRTHLAVPLEDAVLAQLARHAGDRQGHEILLTRWQHIQIAGDKTAGTLPSWQRSHRRPWGEAAEMARPWREVIKAMGLPSGLVPYALRHSSIVRQLRAGLPIQLVAQVHDTSAAMLAKHYAVFLIDASEDLLRRALLPLSRAGADA